MRDATIVQNDNWPKVRDLTPWIPPNVRPEPDAPSTTAPEISRAAQQLGEASRTGFARLRAATGQGYQVTSLRLLHGGAPDLPAVGDLVRELNRLEFEVRVGLMSDAELEARLAKLPDPPSAETEKLWTKDYTAERHALLDAIDRLAALRPNAVLYRGRPEAEQTLKESSIFAHAVDTFYLGDKADFIRYAKTFLEDFPNSPRAPFITDCLAKAS